MEHPELERSQARYPTIFWRAFAAAGVVAAVLVIWGLAVDVAPLAYGAESKIAKLSGLSLDGVMSDDGASLDEIDRRIREVEADVGPADRVMRWMGGFAPAASWLPAVGTEVEGWSSQVSRVRRDVDAASILADASAEVLEVFETAQGSLAAPDLQSDLPELKGRVLEIGPSFIRATRALNEASQLHEVFSAGNLFPRVRNAFGQLESAEERMESVSRIGIEVSDLLSDVLEIARLYQPLIAQFTHEDSDAEPWTGEWLRTTIGDTGFHAETASSRIDVISGLIERLGEGEEFLPRLEQVAQLLEVVRLANRAGEKGLLAVEPALVAVQSSAAGLFGRGGAILTLFEALAERADDLETAVRDLSDARTILRDLSASQSVELSTVAEFIDRLDGGLRLMKGLAPVGSELMGVDTHKHYLVLGQSADELRATGGFVSSVWLVTVDNGDLIDVRYEDAVRVDDWERLMLYPKAPDGIEEHMNAWVWFLRDVSWEPHFPETARTARNMYRVSQRKDVAGVIAINQWTLLRLVEALGTIPDPVDGTDITSRNLLSVLEQGTDTHGRAYMDVIVKGVLDSLSEPMPLSKLLRISDRIYSSLMERDTLLYMDEPRVQAFISESGWDGAVTVSDADYLYVVDSNVGWSKVDRNIERLLKYEVDLSRATQPRATLTLQYNNHSGPGSPPCEPQWRNRGTDYGQQKNACYWNYLRVYVPRNSRMLSTPALPLSEHSVSVEIGRGIPGQNTSRIGSSYDKTVVSGLHVVGAGERKEVTFVYDLPADTVRHEDGLLRYGLTIQKQPGVLEKEVTLAVRAPDGYRLVSGSPVPTETNGSGYIFDLSLTEDLLLDLEFAPVDGGEGN